MAKLIFSALPVLVIAALQLGCVAVPRHAGGLPAHLQVPRPTCDTSVRYIHLAARVRNTTSRDMEFHLDGQRGPRLDPFYMGYRVHSAAPGERFRLVHNSGHDAVWTRTVAIAPGNSAEFNVPIFGLKPVDYLRYFRIELRDSNGRSYWTPTFDLCSVSRANCGCPRLGALAIGSQAERQICRASAPAAGVANNATQVEVGVDCR